MGYHKFDKLRNFKIRPISTIWESYERAAVVFQNSCTKFHRDSHLRSPLKCFGTSDFLWILVPNAGISWAK